jgi:tRNA-2-methylthio-N6-dimethylallyladenosine synthase
MPGQIDETTKSERLQRLQRAIDERQAAFNRSCLGRTFDVLFERPGRHSGQLVGRSPYLQPVQAPAPASLIGDIAAVTITEISSNSLFGALAAVAPRAVATPPAETVLVATGA